MLNLRVNRDGVRANPEQYGTALARDVEQGSKLMRIAQFAVLALFIVLPVNEAPTIILLPEECNGGNRFSTGDPISVLVTNLIHDQVVV